jgi:alpha-tubulin suppressor-like RCC1 family protein
MVRFRGVSLIVMLALPACGGDAGGEPEAPVLAGVTAISAGFLSNCALLDDGTVSCWGWDFEDRNSSSAVAVPRIADAVGVSVGDRHACAVLSDGSVECWGDLSTGASSLGTKPALARPVDGLADAEVVAAGDNHGCALLADATVSCWGWGALGDGSFTGVPGSLRPVSVADVSDVAVVEVGGSSSCALLADGRVKCWGSSWYVGDPPTNETGTARIFLGTMLTAREVDGLSPASSIATGQSLFCAALADSTAACWGRGYFGDGTDRRISVAPVAVLGLTDVIAVSTEESHTCALLAGGQVSCWGYNGSGQLGDGSTTSSFVPVAVTGIDTAIAVAVGATRSCALLADRTVRCWGGSAAGCANGTCRNSPIPMPVRTAP